MHCLTNCVVLLIYSLCSFFMQIFILFHHIHTLCVLPLYCGRLVSEKPLILKTQLHLLFKERLFSLCNGISISLLRGITSHSPWYSNGRDLAGVVWVWVDLRSRAGAAPIHYVQLVGLKPLLYPTPSSSPLRGPL